MSTPCPLNLVLANPRANTMAPIMAKIFPSVVAGANCDKIDEASVCNPAAYILDNGTIPAPIPPAIWANEMYMTECPKP